MRRSSRSRLLALVPLLAVCLTLSADAQGPAPTPEKGTGRAEGSRDGRKLPLEKLIANNTKVAEDDVISVLKALGPAMRERLGSGQTLTLPGLGTFRVVRVAEHRDLIKGVPGVIPAVNYVEFLASGELNSAANSSSAVPAVVVPPSEFIVDPRHVPGLHADSLRTPRSRAEK